MKKITMAVFAAFLSVAFAGAFAGESKGDMKKSDTGMTKSEKGMDKKDDEKKKSKKKDDAAPK